MAPGLKLLARRVCSYCRTVYGYRSDFNLMADTHGICPDCINSNFPEIAERMKEELG